MSLWDKIMHFIGLASAATVTIATTAGGIPKPVAITAGILAYATGAVSGSMVPKKPPTP